MLAYIANREGDAEAAQSYASRQSSMANPIHIGWAKEQPYILNENPEFKETFFNELTAMGISFADGN